MLKKIKELRLSIKKRLVISNILMIAIPVAICLIIGAIGLGLVSWIVETHFANVLELVEQTEEAAESYEPLSVTMKVSAVIIFLIFILTVILSVYFTNRFLTNFVFKKIEQPLELLEEGVAQIRDGNLNHRINYNDDTEFLPVCDAFNEMAVRLKESVEQTMKNEQSRKELLAGISHDIRSPLTSIQAYVEGLIDGIADTPEKRKKYLLTIKQKSESISNMVSQIFTFSKMELDDYPLNLVICNIKTELEKIIRPLTDEYAQNGLIINLNAESCDILLDADLLSRICNNLLSNSLKYNHNHEPEINIYSETDDASYILHFTDNGQGVDKQSMDKLFDVFFRSDLSRNHPDKGSGLGLAIVANAAAKMNASASARNASNNGLDIMIKFPKESEQQ